MLTARAGVGVRGKAFLPLLPFLILKALFDAFFSAVGDAHNTCFCCRNVVITRSYTDSTANTESANCAVCSFLC